MATPTSELKPDCVVAPSPMSTSVASVVTEFQPGSKKTSVSDRPIDNPAAVMRSFWLINDLSEVFPTDSLFFNASQIASILATDDFEIVGQGPDPWF